MVDTAYMMFNGINLKNEVGLHTPELPNIDSTAKARRDVAFISGSNDISDFLLGSDERIIPVKAGFAQTSHHNYTVNRDRLAEILDPELGYCPLVFSDRPSQRLMARVISVEFGRTVIPFLTQVATEINIEFALKHPYWEDISEVQVSDTGTFTIVNAGIEVPAEYLITALDDLPSGFILTVRDSVCIYTGALVLDDEVRIDPSNLVFQKNGVDNCADFTPMHWKQLFLQPGSNQIIISADAKADVFHRRRTR